MAARQPGAPGYPPPSGKCAQKSQAMHPLSTEICMEQHSTQRTSLGATRCKFHQNGAQYGLGTDNLR
jgi:hypothetical protein